MQQRGVWDRAGATGRRAADQIAVCAAAHSSRAAHSPRAAALGPKQKKKLIQYLDKRENHCARTSSVRLVLNQDKTQPQRSTASERASMPSSSIEKALRSSKCVGKEISCMRMATRRHSIQSPHAYIHRHTITTRN